MDKDEYEKLLAELHQKLLNAGLPRVNSKFGYGELSPLDVFVSGGVSSVPYVDILLEYAPRLNKSDRVWLTRVFTVKGLKKAVPYLLSLFNEFDEGEEFWAVGNALYVIDDKASYPSILSICKEVRYGSSRQMLMGTLARMKTREAYEVLLASLNDKTVRSHAIEAIGRFGDTTAIPILEGLEVEKGLFEYKAKNTALRRLYRKLNK